MKRATVIAVPVLLGLVVLAVAYFASTAGFDGHGHRALYVHETTTPYERLPLDPEQVQAQAPKLYALLEKASVEGRAETQDNQAIQDSLDYLNQQGYQGRDVEWRGRFFVILYETS